MVDFEKSLNSNADNLVVFVKKHDSEMSLEKSSLVSSPNLIANCINLDLESGLNLKKDREVVLDTNTVSLSIKQNCPLLNKIFLCSCTLFLLYNFLPSCEALKKVDSCEYGYIIVGSPFSDKTSLDDCSNLIRGEKKGFYK